VSGHGGAFAGAVPYRFGTRRNVARTGAKSQSVWIFRFADAAPVSAWRHGDTAARANVSNSARGRSPGCGAALHPDVLLHELWHINPAFDGDIRRHPGRCFAHTGSQEKYDEAMGELADRWFEMGPPEHTFEFLRHDFDGLAARHLSITGTRYKRPRLLLVQPSTR
jgi:hypothetical protein